MSFARELKQLGKDAISDIADTYYAVLVQHSPLPRIPSNPSHDAAEHSLRLEMERETEPEPEPDIEPEK